jgi:hypothetical protein
LFGQSDIDLKSEKMTGQGAENRLEKSDDDREKEENFVESLEKRENHEAERGDVRHKDENGEWSSKEERGGYLQEMARAIVANSGDLIGRRRARRFIHWDLGTDERSHRAAL